MLNENRLLPVTFLTVLLKSIIGAPLLLVGLAMSLGLAGDSRSEAAEPKKEFFASTKTEDRKAFRTKYISAEKGLLFAARPKEIFELPEFSRLAKLLSGKRGPMAGSPIKLEHIESVLISQDFEEVEVPKRLRREKTPGTVLMPAQNSFYLQLADEYETSDFDTMFPHFKDASLKQSGDEEYYVAEFEKRSPFGGEEKKTVRISKWHPTARSLVVTSDEQMKQVIDGKPQQHPLSKSSNWKAISKSMIAVAIDSTMLKKAAEGIGNGNPIPLAESISAIAKNAASMFASVDVQHDIRGSVLVVFQDRVSAVDAKEEIDELLVAGKKLLKLQANSTNQATRDSVLFAVDLMEDAKVTQHRNEVRINVAIDFEKFVLGPLFDMLTGAESSAKKQQSMNNLKQHSLAALNFESATGRFPQAVIIGPNGHKHSWRVAVLPYLGEQGLQALYDQYRFEEAWDSEHNKKLIASMPAAYRHPDDPEDSISSRYYAFVGPGTVMGGEEGAQFRDIRDGTSKTILYVEAKRDFPWTKPEDIPYDPEVAPDVGEGGFIAAFADGSVAPIAEDVDPATLHSMIQMSDESEAAAAE